MVNYEMKNEKCIFPKTFQECVDTVSQSKYLFGELSFGHQIAVCCNIPFLTFQTFDPDFSMKWPTDLIHNICNRMCIIMDYPIIEEFYSKNKNMFLHEVNEISDNQIKIIDEIENVDITTSNNLNADFISAMEAEHILFDEYFNVDNNKKSTSKFVCKRSNEDDYYKIFIPYIKYIDAIKYINYLCKYYNYIEIDHHKICIIESQINNNNKTFYFKSSSKDRDIDCDPVVRRIY